MPRITVQFDDKLKKPEIRAVLTNSSLDESNRDFMNTMNNEPNIQQTSIYGIITPLISINNITVDFSDVKYFSLKNNGITPQLYIEVYDRYQLITTINTPRLDNTIAVQILPPFDNAYKKINISFYISNMVINKAANLIKITGSYKVPELVSKQYKCLGEMTTYDMLKQIAIDTKLGFATNWENEQGDKRYIYCNDKSYLDLMIEEIKYSLSDNSRIFDCWIDYWNYLNFVNIYERYTTIENLDDDKNMIWISSAPNEMTEGIKIKPHKVPLKLTNHPALTNTELYTDKYEIISKPSMHYSAGSDKVFSIYEENKQEYIDHLYQDGDVKKDVFKGIEYLGEVYGDYNYLLADINRTTYLNKMNMETIKVTLARPLLAITKGCKVDFIWYNIDSVQQSKYNNLEKDGIVKNYDSIETNIPLNETLSKEEQEIYNPANGEFKIDKSISGQYMVLNNNIIYKSGNWFYELTLTRPYSDKPNLLKENI